MVKGDQRSPFATRIRDSLLDKLHEISHELRIDKQEIVEIALQNYFKNIVDVRDEFDKVEE